MIELLLETATDVCAVAVADGTGRLLAEVTATEVHQHASHLTLFIERALLEAGADWPQVDRIVLSDGPGSYTSLRVGAATAKGLCTALPGIEFCTVSTMAALARAVPAGDHTTVLTTLNSRRGEVYGQLFDAATHEAITVVGNVRLTEPTWRGRLNGGRALGKVLVCGPGQERVGKALPDEDNAFAFGEPRQCAARYLMAPARRRPPLAAYEPYYLNPPFVTRSKKKPLL